MIGCLRTRVRKKPIIALYFEFENELKFDNLREYQVCHWLAGSCRHKSAWPLGNRAAGMTMGHFYIFLLVDINENLHVEGVYW